MSSCNGVMIRKTMDAQTSQRCSSDPDVSSVFEDDKSYKAFDSEAMEVFDWTQGDIAFLAMWGGIVSACMCIPFAGIMDKYGIRKMFLLAETFALVGVGVRCLPVGVEHIKWTANIGQFFIALAGPFLVQGPSLVSVTWFPPHHRATATAVTVMAFQFGIAMSFIIGPFVVKEPKTINASFIVNHTDSPSDYYYDYDDIPPEIKQNRIDDIFRLLYIPSLYISATTYGFLLNAAKPLYLEVICEGVYPVAEGIAIGLLNWLSNCIGLVFLFVMTIPHIGVYWMNWTVLGSIIATFLILLVFKEHNKRLTLDKGLYSHT
ncbi:solute carrier family 49 member 4-like [Amphiura filiformis]|uniref:solute carrier family 49 member 4-like n=1 Tax=Amphiura filiformis TaxID=82378 RepID=UPI003B2197D4